MAREPSMQEAPSRSPVGEVIDASAPPEPTSFLLSLQPHLVEDPNSWKGTPKDCGQGGYRWKKSGNIAHLHQADMQLPKIENLRVGKSADSQALESLMKMKEIRASDLTKLEGAKNYAVVEEPGVRGRTVQDFDFLSFSVGRIKIHEIDLRHKASLENSQVAKEVERKLDAIVAPPPDIELVQLVMTDLEENHYPLPGKMDTSKRRGFLKIAALAYLWLHKGQHDAIRSMMKDKYNQENGWRDTYEEVGKKFPHRTEDPFRQFDRDKAALNKPEILDNLAQKNIVVCVDKNDKLLVFNYARALADLYSPEYIEKLIAVVDRWSYYTPIPSPDFTRHPLHVFDWLPTHPEYDVRRAEDAHNAKAGVEHYGTHTCQGDAGGKSKGLFVHSGMTKMFKKTYNFMPNLEHDFFHGAIRKISEADEFCFRALESDLYQEYCEVRRNIDDKYCSEGEKKDGAFTFTAVLINLITQDHVDDSDWNDGLAALNPLGHFTGGDLVLRELGLQLPLPSGSVSLVAGNEVHHSVPHWEGKCRFSVVRTTHEAVRLQAKAKMRSAPHSEASDDDEGEITYRTKAPLHTETSGKALEPTDAFNDSDTSSEGPCLRANDWSAEETYGESSEDEEGIFRLAPYERDLTGLFDASKDEGLDEGEADRAASNLKRKPDDGKAQDLAIKRSKT